MTRRILAAISVTALLMVLLSGCGECRRCEEYCPVADARPATPTTRVVIENTPTASSWTMRTPGQGVRVAYGDAAQTSR